MQSELFDPSEYSPSPKYEIYDWVESAVFAVICMILVFIFVGRNISVVGNSMLPTLQNGDRLLVSRMFYTPAYGDIIVVTKPNNRNEPLIKRVIATEGQEIDIDFNTGEVWVDGILLDEPYIAEVTRLHYDLTFPQLVPKGTVFAMGDNRNDSWDSRDSEIGMIDQRYILGRVVLRLTPVEAFGNPDAWWRRLEAYNE